MITTTNTLQYFTSQLIVVVEQVEQQMSSTQASLQHMLKAVKNPTHFVAHPLFFILLNIDFMF